MLRVRRHDLVPRLQPEPRHDDVAAVGRRARQCDRLRLCPDQRGKLLPDPCAQLEHGLEPRAAAAALLLVEARPLIDRVECRTRERAECARIEVGIALEHREQLACLLVCHSTSRSTGA